MRSDTPLDRAKRVNELSAKATPGPWRCLTQKDWEEGFDFFAGPNGSFAFPVEMEPSDAEWIGETRTLSPALAEDVTQLVALWERCKPLCQHVPEVAEMARELGLLPAVKDGDA